MSDTVLGQRAVARFAVVWQVRIVLALLLIVTNLVGAVVVYCLAALVVPMPAVADPPQLRLENLVLAAFYVPVAVFIGGLRGWALTRKITSWLREGRDPDDAERRALLRTPLQMFARQALLWSIAAVLFGAYNAQESIELGWLVALIVGLAGLSTCSVAYLLTERALRPMVRRALASGLPKRLGVRPVAVRAVLAWLLGSGISTLGVVLVGLSAISVLTEDEVTEDDLSITMIVLGGIAFVIGGLTAYLAAKATSDPVRALRRAVAAVGEGKLDVEVPIYDGTEIGILQAGFNEMVAGLRERERIRDLFGRHVGDDVAMRALTRGVELGGEVREVAVLFVDVVGSTSLAEKLPPDEVVAVLNRFFDVVIDVVHEYDGWINKFEGDAALAIWGAPVAVEDRDSRILAAARVMGERLARAVPEVGAGIGVSSGMAVAGNVGAAERYEYTVIGDPVNEAARLTDVAKTVPRGVVANARLVDGASQDEAARWTPLEPVVVRGRTEPTPLATPRD
ncbi:MAG TPA: adenylate/guanylate cyclase domain-containing protein [Nocardioidaceae bacterium]|nr:adenylate/guanylate cyclase domain-containing protein [Nocardioidaceae bacterium]